jgi:DNA (cytosine-5)-methyltransferase 1/tRNA (cytosine38-C5)-methyltransferase
VTAPLRVLELFSGLGGWRYALGGRGTVVAAYDIHPGANATYALNHKQRPLDRNLATLPLAALAGHGADTWMMSPPCQPFCRMGNQSDVQDPRAAPYLRLMEVLDAAPPDHLVLENVVGFLDTRAHAVLLARLDRHGFHRLAFSVCASRFGMPNLRPRTYVVASRQPLRRPALPELQAPALAGFLDAEEDERLYLGPEHLRHTPGLDLVRPEDARSSCFIGGYGQRFTGSGSFLVTPRGIRRFSPGEVARLLGYPGSFRFPEGLSLLQRYKLLGNGLSLPVARWVVGHLDGDPGWPGA